METFVTSYKGMRINATENEEREGILANSSEALTDFIREATSGILFKIKPEGIPFKGIFAKSLQ